MSWEGVLSFIWILIQSIFWICAILGMLILGTAIIIGALRGLKNGIVRKDDTSVDKDSYFKEAAAVAKDMYSTDSLMPEELTRAFKAGAMWGWEHRTRK